MSHRRTRITDLALAAALLAAGCDPGAAARERALRAELAHSRAAIEEARRELAELRASGERAVPSEDVAELRAELEREQLKRIQREREWLKFTRALSALELRSLPEDLTFESELPAEEVQPEPAPPVVIDEAKLAREAEIARSIRTLLSIEGVRGIDLLEVGELHGGWVGPVLFRIVDEGGRLAGSLFAERLRLEGSRTAHSVTLVLEDGYEMREGVRIPFGSELRLDQAPLAGGVRRLDIVETDPMDWVGALPELFGDTSVEAPVDDGRWSLVYVRGALNRLLKADAASGYWRLKALGGVHGEVLRVVHLENFDREGRLDRRVFADRLHIAKLEKGVVLELDDGAQVRGTDKAPFLDGHFRIFLPRALHADWDAAGLPGLAEPDGSASAQGSATSD